MFVGRVHDEPPASPGGHPGPPELDWDSGLCYWGIEFSRHVWYTCPQNSAQPEPPQYRLIKHFPMCFFGKFTFQAIALNNMAGLITVGLKSITWRNLLHSQSLLCVWERNLEVAGETVSGTFQAKDSLLERFPSVLVLAGTTHTHTHISGWGSIQPREYTHSHASADVRCGSMTVSVTHPALRPNTLQHCFPHYKKLAEKYKYNGKATFTLQHLCTSLIFLPSLWSAERAALFGTNTAQSDGTLHAAWTLK